MMIPDRGSHTYIATRQSPLVPEHGAHRL